MLKAARYAEGANPDLVAFIESDLPFLSFDEACDFYAEVVPEMRDREVALLGANDRFFLLTGLCNRTDAINEWCYNRAREVEADPDGHIDLWARFHYKSSLITFAGSIQEIINDPEITIGVFSVDQGVSQPFVEQIKRELEDNDYLKRIYADVFWQNPRREASIWSAAKGIVVKRKGNPKEATVEAHSILKLPTGRHFGLRIYNDMINELSVTETATDQIGKITQQWELSQNLGKHDSNRMWVEGTRYHFADVHGTIIDRGTLKARLYPATHDGTMTGRPIFLSSEKWEQIKRDQRSTVAAQMLLNPLAGKENTFSLEWLRPYELRPIIMNIWIIGDPSAGRNRRSDRTAIPVIGIDAQLNRYLLDGYCHRMKPSQRYEAMKDLFLKWKKAPGVQMVRVAWERFGMQEDLEYFEEKILAQKIEGLSLDEVSWPREGPGSKRGRIARLEPYFRNSQFWVPANVWHPDLGPATWSVRKQSEPVATNTGEPIIDKNTGKQMMKEVEGSAEILYHPYQGPSRAERDATLRGEKYRIMPPIKRLNEDGEPYDLFRVFAEEFKLEPFAPHDDLLDATSRIQDVEVVPPIVYERVEGDSWSRAFPDA